MASIAKRANGSWRARYRDDAGREHAKHFSRKVDAQRWLDEVTADVVTGNYVDPKAGRLTLASFFTEWSDRQVWASGTEKAMVLAVRSCTFNHVELRHVRRSHVEAWIKGMVKAGLAAGTIRTRTNNVRSILKGAIGDRLIAKDPSAGVTLPRARKTEHAMVIPSTEDVGRLLAASEPWFRPYIALCAFAGLRLGEAAAVQLADVDFLRRSLHVQRQVQRASEGKIEITPPKYGSERTVFLADALLQMLSWHVQEIGTRGTEQWLFVGDKGLPPHQNTIGYWWRKTRKDAGAEAARKAKESIAQGAADADKTAIRPSALSTLKLHDLRHFYASGLIAAGCDVVTVQRALGHAKATTTLNTYAHLWPTAEDRTRAAAGQMMETALNIPADSLRTQEA